MPPIIGHHPRTLILGSMPSIASLHKQQYYGHPRNAFWPLMAQLLKFEHHRDYAINVERVRQHGIAIWDVIAECERRGSLDSAIVKGSVKLNRIPELVAAHPGLTRIGLNGGTAARLFERHCLPALDAQRLRIFRLPSTSPANARMTFAAKCEAWQPLFQA